MRNAAMKLDDTISDVAEAFTTSGTGWTAGLLIDGRVEWATCVDWVPYEKRGTWGVEFADRLNAKGRFQPVFALHDLSERRLGQDCLWTSERRMKAWLETQTDFNSPLGIEIDEART